MRGFGWLLVVLGLLLIVGTPVLATLEYNARVDRWVAEGKAYTAAVKARRRPPTDAEMAKDYVNARRMMDLTPRPSSWMPGELVGGGLFALGVLVLAVRRPERTEG